ncbi:glycosyltransferase [Thalassobellus sediminis]|uniref:glycosyltransferase n=1 Tax=Thalassobellus sediminis TaxID=3367753 RepID=UPI0037A89F2C
MRILMVSRATLFLQPGGDTIQITKTAAYINKFKGVSVDVKTVNDSIDYSNYDLLHLFNICRPSDLLGVINKSKLPYVISTIFVDFSEVEKNHFQKSRLLLSKLFSLNQMEYIKAIGRFLKKQEKITDYKYFIFGHKKSVKWIIKNAELLLPNSESEYNRLYKSYGLKQKYYVIPNGIDISVFKYDDSNNSKYNKFKNSIISVGQITPVKNHLNLIQALNNTKYNVYIIGAPTLNATKYYNKCLETASDNIHFIPKLKQEELSIIYTKAKVHVLASWFETTGLVSLEAAYLGCNIVITNRGDQMEYFEDYAFYCNPKDISSIRLAVDRAYSAKTNIEYREKILAEYNWDITAQKTIKAYKEVLKVS